LASGHATAKTRSGQQHPGILNGSYRCGAECRPMVGNVQPVAVLGGAEELLVAARGGDQASFERLIEPQIGIGYRLAAAMLNDRSLAEDAVQEATLRAWRSMGQLRDASRVRGWFLSIVANRSRSIRHVRWWSVIRLRDAAAGLPSPADTVDQREDLARALGRLSPNERAAVLLRFYEGMSSREVGETLGITATGARSRIHRALRRLRVDLAEEEL
jgi:RNA polymerase sigma-70 factor, ECF subfamily